MTSVLIKPNYVQETARGKFVEFRFEPTSKSELESWIESEIARKLAPDEGGEYLWPYVKVTVMALATRPVVL